MRQNFIKRLSDDKVTQIQETGAINFDYLETIPHNSLIDQLMINLRETLRFASDAQIKRVS